MFNFSVLYHKKIQNQKREGGKKAFERKNIEPIFGKVNKCDEIKKKTLEKFIETLMRATK